MFLYCMRCTTYRSEAEFLQYNVKHSIRYVRTNEQHQKQFDTLDLVLWLIAHLLSQTLLVLHLRSIVCTTREVPTTADLGDIPKRLLVDSVCQPEL